MLRFAIPAALACSTAAAAPRDVQIATVDLDAGVVRLTNFGAETQDLTGWRFCSNNTSVVLRYSGASGFDGMSLAPAESLDVHLNDDASGPGAINYSDLGGSVAPIDRTAYSISIYFPDAGGTVVFGDGNLMADFLQFSLNGMDNTTANIRTDEAVNGGVWESLIDWIPISTFSSSIDLTNPNHGVNNSGDYAVNEPCLVDLAAPFGTLNFFDIAEYINFYNAMDPAADLAAPFGLFNFFDIAEFIDQYNAGCP